MSENRNEKIQFRYGIATEKIDAVHPSNGRANVDCVK